MFLEMRIPLFIKPYLKLVWPLKDLFVQKFRYSVVFRTKFLLVVPPGVRVLTDTRSVPKEVPQLV